MFFRLLIHAGYVKKLYIVLVIFDNRMPLIKCRTMNSPEVRYFVNCMMVGLGHWSEYLTRTVTAIGVLTIDILIEFTLAFLQFLIG